MFGPIKVVRWDCSNGGSGRALTAFGVTAPPTKARNSGRAIPTPGSRFRASVVVAPTNLTTDAPLMPMTMRLRGRRRRNRPAIR